MKSIVDKAYIKHGLIPAFFYLIAFCLLTWPLITRFNTHFLTDTGDGFQHIWNMWWVGETVLQPGQYPSIWHTTLLHWPFGTTLYAHALNPFNGYMAVILTRYMSLNQAHNTLVVFAFVMSGLTAYWLAYTFTRSHMGSLAGGYIFTFSTYHFAHYHGQLNLISLEWIPLFLLLWYRFIKNPTILMGLASALVLWLVLLCDYYYFFYSILVGGLIVAWEVYQRRNIRTFFERNSLIPFCTFIFLTLILIGQVVFPAMRVSRIDPFLDAHKPENFSLDLLALFIPGENWQFGHLTKAYWSKLPLGLSEISVYLGYSVIILLGYIWVKRRRVEFTNQIYLWFIILGFFFIMALGPSLRINGNIVYSGPMPYELLEIILPFLKLSGVPVRMVAIVTLAASVLSAMAIREFPSNTQKNRLIVSAVLLLLVFELLPAPLPTAPTSIPAYAYALEKLPNDGGVLDLAAPTRYLHLYYQTAHHKPLVFGYISRIPASVSEQESGLKRAINRDDYIRLWDVYHIRYIVTKDAIEYENSLVSIELVYQDGEINIYRLGLNEE